MARINTKISDENAAKLNAAARRAGMTKADMVDAALDLFFSPERDEHRDAAILRRLDRLTRQYERLQRDGQVVAETLALFVRYYLSITPPLPDDAQDAARAQGRDRFEMFVRQLTKRIAGGGSLIRDVLDDVIASEADFFSEEDALASGDTPPWEDEADHA